MADSGKTPPKGKAKGGGAGKGSPGAGKISGVVKSVDKDNGTGEIQADDGGEVHTFELKNMPDNNASDGMKVRFKSAGKKGKKEAKDIEIVAEEGSKAEAQPEAASAPDEKVAVKAADQPPAKAAAKGEVEATAESKDRVLRDDEECFVADYTGNKTPSGTPKFVQFSSVHKARISRDLVEADEDVSLRIRKEPSKDADELMCIGADDTVEIVGKCGDWLRLAGDEERWMLSIMKGEEEDIETVEVFSSGFFGGSWGTIGSAPVKEDEKPAEKDG
eukprot:CAMPEP_0181313202 /NCGR_PEP_ID=MMETSP1101-20121128/14121_1 /TAXON_ID=46948 /ORGANISM="Rhodomonas abbreviata, Strain Caron Lab Isolate" /LENGTH=274 /DNA_ID=CAMNT_0023420137 /DNA_START=20 /DNA_END=840 /DNA_ORIENTATION=-